MICRAPKSVWFAEVGLLGPLCKSYISVPLLQPRVCRRLLPETVGRMTGCMIDCAPADGRLFKLTRWIAAVVTGSCIALFLTFDLVVATELRQPFCSDASTTLRVLTLVDETSQTAQNRGAAWPDKKINYCLETARRKSLLLATSLWTGFSNATDQQKIQAFIKRSKNAGFCNTEWLNLTILRYYVPRLTKTYLPKSSTVQITFYIRFSHPLCSRTTIWEIDRTTDNSQNVHLV